MFAKMFLLKFVIILCESSQVSLDGVYSTRHYRKYSMEISRFPRVQLRATQAPKKITSILVPNQAPSLSPSSVTSLNIFFLYLFNREKKNTFLDKSDKYNFDCLVYYSNNCFHHNKYCVYSQAKFPNSIFL